MPLPPEWMMSLRSYSYRQTVGPSTKAFPHLRCLLSNGSMMPYKLGGAAVGVEVMNVSHCVGMLSRNVMM
ncbi:hypothetical protein Sjap_011495 [Stephania japonica]|uniref:Uncharacterized protein n=1 Tax=Stephania japonica TaxID=461633 RepID=A0AAP0JBM0_9MAGN